MLIQRVSLFALTFLFLFGQNSFGNTSPEKEILLLKAGDYIVVRTSETLTTKFARAGDRFLTELAYDITRDGKVVVPAGTLVEGLIIESVRARNLGKRALLSIELTHLLYDGERIPLVTSIEHSEGQSGRTGAKVGGGAIIGGILGGWSGAKSGALIGLGVSAVTKGKQIEVPEGSLLEFRLRQSAKIQTELIKY